MQLNEVQISELLSLLLIFHQVDDDGDVARYLMIFKDISIVNLFSDIAPPFDTSRPAAERASIYRRATAVNVGGGLDTAAPVKKFWWWGAAHGQFDYKNKNKTRKFSCL